MGANEDVRDMLVQHQHFIERFRKSEVREILRILRQADDDIRNVLLTANITDWNRNRLETILTNIRDIEATYERQVMNRIRSTASSFGASEVGTLKQVVEEAAGEAIRISPLNFTVPSPESIYALAADTPILMNDNVAVMMEPFLQGIPTARRDAIERSIRYSYAVGEPPSAAARRLLGSGNLDGAIKRARNTAEAITRTTLNHMSSTARRATYEQNTDLVKGYQWLSTLDRRTSPICQDYDGRVWITDEEERAKSNEPSLPGEVYPPAHPNCRSTTTPLIRSWKELGIQRGELPDSTRASMNGQVPARTTYLKWLQDQPAGVQREVLGTTRYRMWRNGEIKIENFYDTGGGFYTLGQLQRRGYSVPGRGT